MGAFTVILSDDADDSRQVQAEVRGSLESQGFRSFKQIAGEGYSVILCPKQNGTPCGFYEDEDASGFCAIIGTLIYRGNFGKAAARQLYSDFDGDAIPYDGAIGSYCVVIRKYGRIFLWIDQLGLYKTYLSKSRRVWTSSFLAAISANSGSSLDRQAVYEYVFQGATYGCKTVVKGVSLAEPGVLFNLLKPDLSVGSQSWLSDNADTSLDVFDSCINSVREVFNAASVAGFNVLDSAVSGGYDSRLMLSLLLELDVDLRLHVYGREESADVRNAKAIGSQLDLTIDHVDKANAAQINPDEYAVVVHRNFLAFDGLPTDGIFDNGSDLQSRRHRAEDGALMLNGGGGEVFRNFFYLNDRRYSVREILWSFYSQYSPAYCTSRFDSTGYLDCLKDGIMACLGTDQELLERKQVEMIYSLFRLRFWMGKNNSINNRFGWSLTPFSEPTIVRNALCIPIHEKNSGRFEARMIHKLSPLLAACPSNYGHDFAGEPPIGRRIKDFLTSTRPPRLRRYTYRLKQKLLPPISNPYLSKQFLDVCIPGGIQTMKAYFAVKRIRDPAVFARVATIEYLCSQGLVSSID